MILTQQSFLCVSSYSGLEASANAIQYFMAAIRSPFDRSHVELIVADVCLWVAVLLFHCTQASCEVVKTFTLEHPGTSCVEIRRDQKLFVSGGWDHRQAISRTTCGRSCVPTTRREQSKSKRARVYVRWALRHFYGEPALAVRCAKQVYVGVSPLSSIAL